MVMIAVMKTMSHDDDDDNDDDDDDADKVCSAYVNSSNNVPDLS